MGTVVTYTHGGYDDRTHECSTRAAVARVLARLLGYDFGGEYDAGGRYARGLQPIHLRQGKARGS